MQYRHVLLAVMVGIMGFVSLPAFAGSMGTIPGASPIWSVTGSIGYTVFDGVYSGDANTAVGRLAIGRSIFASNSLTWGLELGVQSGNNMRYIPSEAAIEALGGLPIQSTIKPILDVLVTLTTSSFETIPVFAQLKGGVAYRHWQFNDRTSINDETQIAGEVQIGFGHAITQSANLSLSYQGIFGAHPNFTYNKAAEFGHVSYIPIQQGLLLGLTIIL